MFGDDAGASSDVERFACRGDQDALDGGVTRHLQHGVWADEGVAGAVGWPDGGTVVAHRVLAHAGGDVGAVGGLAWCLESVERNGDAHGCWCAAADG